MNRSTSAKRTIWARRAGWAVVPLVAAVATVWIWRWRSLPVAPPAAELAAEVKRVRHGTMVELNSDEKLVYAGVVGPYEQQPLYTIARDRNRQLVESKTVRLRYDEGPQTDKKGRRTAYVFADGVFVNETLVREGLAYVRLTTGATRYADRLLAAQQEARKQKRGLWALARGTPETQYPADPKYGHFHRRGCAEVPNIKPDRRRDFESRSAALDVGLAPCPQCTP